MNNQNNSEKPWNIEKRTQHSEDTRTGVKTMKKNIEKAVHTTKGTCASLGKLTVSDSNINRSWVTTQLTITTTNNDLIDIISIAVIGIFEVGSALECNYTSAW